MRDEHGAWRFDQGYREGYAACLAAGSSASARLHLQARLGRDHAYESGYEWALYDYDDANGLPAVAEVRRLRF